MRSRSFFPLVLLLAIAVVGVFAGVRLFRRPAAPVSYELGRGSTIVLLHGLGSRVDDWIPVARALGRSHHVVLVELPGHGASEMPEPFSLARAAESLDGALARLGDEPVVLVGHSLGGLVAFEEALAHPGRVSGLVLVETALTPGLNESERAEMLAALANDYDGFVRAAYRSFGRDSLQGERLAERAAGEDRAMMTTWIRLALTTDVAARGAALAVPALAIVSERSWTRDETEQQASDALGFRAIRKLWIQRLFGTGHFVMLDDPAGVADSIERFARRAQPGPVAVRPLR